MFSRETELNEILDLTYEAVVRPQAWGEVGERASHIFGGAVAICRHGPQGSDMLAYTGDVEQALTYQAYYDRFDRPLSHLLAGPTLDVTTTDETPDVPDVFRHDYLNRFGHQHLMYGRAPVRQRGDLVVGVSRSARRGGFDAGERRTALFLARHLSRAAAVTQAAGALLADLNALEQALEHQGIAVLIVDADGHVRSRNIEADRLVRCGELRLVHERLRWPDVPTDGALRRAIAAATDRSRRVASCLRARGASGAELEIDVVPLREAQGALLLVKPPPCRPRAPRLARAYGLTPAESRLLLALSEGERLAAYAEQAGIALSTAKTHLRALFEKTGVNRQADLVRLAAGRPQ